MDLFLSVSSPDSLLCTPAWPTIHYIAQADLQLRVILLSQPLESWDDRCRPPHPAYRAVSMDSVPPCSSVCLPCVTKPLYVMWSSIVRIPPGQMIRRREWHARLAVSDSYTHLRRKVAAHAAHRTQTEIECGDDFSRGNSCSVIKKKGQKGDCQTIVVTPFLQTDKSISISRNQLPPRLF